MGRPFLAALLRQTDGKAKGSPTLTRAATPPPPQVRRKKTLRRRAENRDKIPIADPHAKPVHPKVSAGSRASGESDAPFNPPTLALGPARLMPISGFNTGTVVDRAGNGPDKTCFARPKTAFINKPCPHTMSILPFRGQTCFVAA